MKGDPPSATAPTSELHQTILLSLRRILRSTREIIDRLTPHVSGSAETAESWVATLVDRDRALHATTLVVLVFCTTRVTRAVLAPRVA